LLHLVPGHLLDALCRERAHVDPALRALRGEEIHHLLELEVVVGVEREPRFGLLDARVRALEVEAGLELLVRLIDGVLELHLVDFRSDIERRHAGAPVRAGRDYTARGGSCRWRWRTIVPASVAAARSR